MQFILIAHDKPGALPLRMATRAAHLAFCEQLIGTNLLFGGPLLADDGSPKGSVLVIEAASEAQARRIFDQDPYIAAGLFADVAINGFRHVFTNGVQI